MRVIMRFAMLVALGSSFLLSAGPVLGQGKKNEEDFLKEKPAIGDSLPDLIVYSPDGKEVKTSSLRGQHVVLTFGCLT
jgi:cytochrome oxidase Cu insertion factor (SCO1/SenC/PrrC family)